MSTIKRHKRISQRELTPYKKHELLTGTMFYPMQGYDGYGDGKSTNVADYNSDEMRADWQAHRDDFLKF